MSESVQTFTVDEAFGEDPKTWLLQKAGEHRLEYLLAHADDGVIWGKVSNNKLSLSGDVFKDVLTENDVERSAIVVKLSAETLQQARLFGPAGELWLWRTSPSPPAFAGRLIIDGKERTENALEEEDYHLWGDQVKAKQGDFTLLEEGQQGLFHAPPTPQAVQEQERVALVVRHYVGKDAADQAYISHSRLKDLKIVKQAVKGDSTSKEGRER
jgi:CRISPR-associated protein (TIGR03984 family)